MEFIFAFFLLFSKFYLFILDFSAFSFLVPCVLPYVHPRPAIHCLATNVSEALFYTGVDSPFQGPFLGRPILGASNHFYSGFFANFCGLFNCWCEKTRETLNRHFILPKVQKHKQ